LEPPREILEAAHRNVVTFIIGRRPPLVAGKWSRRECGVIAERSCARTVAVGPRESVIGIEREMVGSSLYREQRQGRRGEAEHPEDSGIGHLLHKKRNVLEDVSGTKAKPGEGNVTRNGSHFGGRIENL
jgi:hypothetical protein